MLKLLQSLGAPYLQRPSHQKGPPNNTSQSVLGSYYPCTQLCRESKAPLSDLSQNDDLSGELPGDQSIGQRTSPQIPNSQSSHNTILILLNCQILFWLFTDGCSSENEIPIFCWISTNFEESFLAPSNQRHSAPSETRTFSPLYCGITFLLLVCFAAFVSH